VQKERKIDSHVLEHAYCLYKLKSLKKALKRLEFATAEDKQNPLYLHLLAQIVFAFHKTNVFRTAQ
jgi:hypothetical protein